MSATVIDGKKIAEDIRADIGKKVLELKKRGIIPCLAVILVGSDPASVSYVTGKKKALVEAGMKDLSFRLQEDVPEHELLRLIKKLNEEKSVHGILVQLPLPVHISEEKVLLEISPEKDVDGFHPLNVGKMMIGKKAFLPCTPHGILVLLKKSGIKTDGAHAVVIGRSNIVGKPVSVLLTQKEYNCTVTICHTGTKNLSEITRSADILIAAAGKPLTVTADMVKSGAAVIDVGVNRIPDGSKKSGFRLTGDVDFERVKEVASYITPVPGGVGPMTIAMLLSNTLEAAQNVAVGTRETAQNAAAGADLKKTPPASPETL
ncbi:bifunctional 5,10-methylene-tetrahydrofolate dehydrogenase/5,10-methylene-tetrahydrofolate cyclohydrolase [Treponema parvum]|uniref:Bifunctional protein FolD n=1 Tax=Treponema parvum TaxID=138851 RepID=A0A975F4T1_9SPIR|nr:tetrahydrofolate dehydrogenase/cyclohydrolase catalytic domain-containing protein [Treponema parvum]QTQ14659.1 bifunctional 5,10-methylene-tetrahydrofolate dehydrogenase/5,10-methylene-tetrahydrofolate cyclohydrolase [Treponema parvum]